MFGSWCAAFSLFFSLSQFCFALASGFAARRRPISVKQHLTNADVDDDDDNDVERGSYIDCKQINIRNYAIKRGLASIAAAATMCDCCATLHEKGVEEANELRSCVARVVTVCT